MFLWVVILGLGVISISLSETISRDESSVSGTTSISPWSDGNWADRMANRLYHWQWHGHSEGLFLGVFLILLLHLLYSSKCC